MPLSDEHRQTLRALVECVIMNDARDRVFKHMSTAFNDDEDTAKWLEHLRVEASAVFGQDFVTLAVETRDELLDRLESGNWRTEWPVDVQAVLDRIVQEMERGYLSSSSQPDKPLDG